MHLVIGSMYWLSATTLSSDFLMRSSVTGGWFLQVREARGRSSRWVPPTNRHTSTEKGERERQRQNKACNKQLRGLRNCDRVLCSHYKRTFHLLPQRKKMHCRHVFLFFLPDNILLTMLALMSCTSTLLINRLILFWRLSPVHIRYSFGCKGVMSHYLSLLLILSWQETNMHQLQAYNK